jgi:tetratricopeptide (TPR) repeat protein
MSERLHRDFFRWPSRESLFYYGCVAALVSPIWVNEYFVTLDGPMHLANARLLLDHLAGGDRAGLFGPYLVPNFAPFPYWFGHVSLALLLALFSAELAAKIFLTAYVVLFSLVLRRAITRLNRDASFLSFPGLVLICNRPFQMGFLSFAFSQVFFLLLVIHWIEHPRRLTAGRLLQRAGLFLLLYFSHPTTYGLAVVVVGLLTLWACVYESPRLSSFDRPRVLGLLAEGARFAATVLPSALLLVWYTVTGPSYQSTAWVSYWAPLGGFLTQSGLTLVNRLEAPFGVATAIGIFGLAAATADYRRRARTLALADGFLVAFVPALAIHLYGSHSLTGFFERLQTLPLVLLLLWSTSRLSWPRYRHLASVASACVLASLLVIRQPIYAQASENAKEVMSVLPALQAGSTILPLNYAPYGCARNGRRITNELYLLLHVTDYLAASQKGLLTLDNIGLLYPMFPLQWRADRNPFAEVRDNAALTELPPRVELDAYPRRTGGLIDYVLLWCLDERFEEHPEVVDLMRQLERRYEKVATSTHGQLVAYRRRLGPALEVGAGPAPAAPAQPVTASEQALGDILAGKSAELYRAGKFVDAVAAARAAVALNGRSAIAYNNLCAAHLELREWDEAIAACQEALRIDPTLSLARNNLDAAVAGRRQAAHL